MNASPADAPYATHDHKPVRALWEEASEKQTSSLGSEPGDNLEDRGVRRGSSSLRGNELPIDDFPAIMQPGSGSNAWIAVIMITDLLGLRDRFNVPGTAVNTN